MEASKPYQEAVSTGQYQKRTGLFGIYDNVRRLWEEQVIQLFLSPFLRPLVREKKKGKLRILDLGCGSGDGYELITQIPDMDKGLKEKDISLISSDMLEKYLGFDISPALVEQGRSIYKDNKKVEILEGDFSQGLPQDIIGEAPYDVYFTSFGTLSHNEDDQNIKLLEDIAKHCGSYALIVADWLGRYSYEWQSLWTKDLSQNRFIDYVISYIYPEKERKKEKLENFPLRLMTRQEAEDVIKKAGEKAGVEIEIEKFFDYSLFVGRHMDTGDYNEFCRPIRRGINSLFEVNVRTNLESILIDYHPKSGFDFLNDFFEEFQMCWNNLVEFSAELLNSYDLGKEVAPKSPQLPDELKKARYNMKKVVEGTACLKDGDPRANIIEPQLGYALRRLEMFLQRGIGSGHSLVAVLKIRK